MNQAMNDEHAAHTAVTHDVAGAGGNGTGASASSIDDDRARFLGYGPELTAQRAEELAGEYEVAWLLALGLDADEIAERVNLSRASVYRLLRSAEEDHGLLDRRPRVAVPVGEGAEFLWQRVERSDLGERVRGHLVERHRHGSETAPREVLVAPTAGLDKTEDREERSRAVVRRVGHVAARRVMRGLLDSSARAIRVMGINWGFHCWALSHALPAELYARLPVERARELRIFPLAGSIGLLDEDRQQYIAETSATANAERCVENLTHYGLEPRLRADEEDAPIPPPMQLTQPAVIPHPVDGGDCESYIREVWRYIASDMSVQAIFGHEWALSRLEGDVPEHDPEGPLLHQADTLITGLSTGDDSRAVRIGAISEQLAGQARAGAAKGEISAHYFSHAEDSEDCREALRAVNRWVVAPTIDDYVQCTRRARETGRGLGTVLVVSQKRKTAAVDAAISHGAVNVLVCDEELAQELLEI